MLTSAIAALVPGPATPESLMWGGAFVIIAALIMLAHYLDTARPRAGRSAAGPGTSCPTSPAPLPKRWARSRAGARR